MVFKKWLTNEPKSTVICVLFSVVALIVSFGGWLNALLPFDIAWIAIVLCGAPIVTGAATALIREHNIKADLLVSLALIASVITSEFFAAGEVAFIMQIGSLLEDFTANRARKGIESLIKLTPKTARVKRDCTDAILPVEEVVVGDTLTVLAGETIPVDGILLSGETSVDQSVMTGESIPVDKKTGDELISGTINQYGTFEMKATKACADSSLQRMIALANEADANKAPIVGLADKWASWMVVTAVLCAVATGLLSGEFIRAVTVLVVFCPCAFVLATPTAVAAAIGNLTKYGILIRTGDALERLSKVNCVAFDKTGTLTYGKPRVIGVETFRDDMGKHEILRLTALAEQRSEHPLGKAIFSNYTENGGNPEVVSDIQILAGQGIQAIIDGKTVLVGKPDLFPLSKNAKETADGYFNRGATVVFLSVDGALCGLVALADTVRSESSTAVERLKVEAITPILLTGDNEAAASSIASSVGIVKVRANLLPEEKMSVIKEYGENGKKVCMIGDGVNDALALSTAYAGIAMGGVGSDIAVESADAVLVSDDIKRLPYLFFMTQKAMSKVKQNIIISLAIDFAAVVLSFYGLLNPVTGALVHNFGSVFVVVNAALLLKEKDCH
ncbi:MAG TPA: cation-translocating P-type ATPase [Spirochaetia bacterium]|nr:cation-translocating P-type ATPase [Spirochaetia bacterium]HRV27198.1 cation-translocating P-type ATPase [Spirochaetia bacterium]